MQMILVFCYMGCRRERSTLFSYTTLLRCSEGRPFFVFIFLFFIFLMIRRPPRSTLFPYTTLSDLTRGKEALDRLKVFDGIPPPYDTQKRLVVPAALKVLRLSPNRRFCVLGRLSHEVGWKYQNIISTLEAKRKTKSKKFYEAKKSNANLRCQAMKIAIQKAPEAQKVIESYGFA